MAGRLFCCQAMNFACRQLFAQNTLYYHYTVPHLFYRKRQQAADDASTIGNVTINFFTRTKND